MSKNHDTKTQTTKSLIAAASLVLVYALASGCVDSNDGADAGDTGNTSDSGTEACQKSPPSMPAAHACWHVCTETPIDIDAATKSATSPPTVQFGKTYSISLNDDGDNTFSGTVRFNGSEEGREAIGEGETKQMHFHTVADVPMNATAVSSSAELSPLDSNEYQCDQGLRYSKVFEMGPERYDVQLGPTDRQQVILVVVPLNGPAFK